MTSLAFAILVGVAACVSYPEPEIQAPRAAIAAMGDKIESKKIADAAGVNKVPGHLGEIEDADAAIDIMPVYSPVILPTMASRARSVVRRSIQAMVFCSQPQW